MTDVAATLPRLLADVTLPLDRFELKVRLETNARVTGIFGASGSGKTSLIETIAGLRRGARGTVRLGPETWQDGAVHVPPERRGIGYVPQEGLLFPDRTVRDNLLAGRRRAEREGRGGAATLEQVAALLELTDLLERRADTLSGGERQRAALGRAICSGPRLLLLDEPLASLDLPLRRRLLPFLARVRREFAVPMLLVSHDPVEVQSLCDEVVVLRDGREVAHGDPRAVLTDPEVFPLAALEGFENVLPCRIARDGSGSAVMLGDGDGALALVTSPTAATPGTAALVGIPARDIILATEQPRGLSARNVLPAVVTGLRGASSMSLVALRLRDDLPQVTVEITERTAVEMGLQKGREIFLVIKAASCRVYANGA